MKGRWRDLNESDVIFLSFHLFILIRLFMMGLSNEINLLSHSITTLSHIWHSLDDGGIEIFSSYYLPQWEMIQSPGDKKEWRNNTWHDCLCWLSDHFRTVLKSLRCLRYDFDLLSALWLWFVSGSFLCHHFFSLVIFLLCYERRIEFLFTASLVCSNV